ncbi:MAG: DUF4270 family protein [Ferruginibacter sp.]
MHKRVLPAAFLSFLFVVLLAWGCTKLDTTNLGTDLIPAVDNVHTFRDTFNIETTQGFFNDTSVVTLSDNYALGTISNDPLFGTTEANIYLQLKPPFYPYYFGFATDTVKNYTGVGVDSVVLCLSYKGVWGDTNTVQQIQVSEITDERFTDSLSDIHNVNYQPQIGAALSNVVTVDTRRIGKDTVRFNQNRDSVINQIRIKLSDAFAQELYDQDSALLAPKKGFRNDSIYRKTFKGLAVKSLSGNGLMYVNLTDENTRLEVHYRKFRRNKYDTVYSVFPLQASSTPSISPSATANYVHRDRTGSESVNPTADALYIQGGPGTFAKLHFPGLRPDTITNRIIHRADIVIEQIPGSSFYDSIFSTPILYLDLIDTSTATPKWKPIYYDLDPAIFYNPDLAAAYYPGGVDHSYFGSISRTKVNQLGQTIRYYNINVSRYMQNLFTGKIRNYDMRLFAPFKFRYPQYSPFALQYDNPVGFGRIKVGGGSNPNYRMRLVMTWTKL